MEKHKYGHMKTTLNVRDDLFRRAKAQAALKGITLGTLVEQALERVLREEKKSDNYWVQWAKDLPRCSDEAVAESKKAFDSDAFREIGEDIRERLFRRTTYG